MKEKIKLDKSKISEKWENSGGRKVSVWCNYYLIDSGDGKYFVEKANLKAYLVVLLLSPILIPILLILLTSIGIYKSTEWLVNKTNKPLQAVFMTLFTKDKVRSDWLSNNEYIEMLNFKKGK